MNKKLILPLIAIALVLTATAAAAFVGRSEPEKPAALNDTDAVGTPAIAVELSSDQQAYRTGDKVVFRSIVRNTTSSPLSYTFNSTCTQGTLSIDGTATQRSLVCGDAITDVVLEPGQEKAYTYQFSLVSSLADVTQERLPAGTIDYDNWLALAPGEHQAQLEWRGFKSEPVTFSVN